jgi:predicted transcriptional regulator
MYVTSPTKAIQGFSRVQRVSQKPPIELWDEVRGEVGINRSEFDAYFQDANQAVGIHLGTSCRLIRSIKLGEIRNEWDGFHPPQSFRYLSSSQLEAILNVQNKNGDRPTGSRAIPIS